MLFRNLAQAVVIVHLGFVLFVGLGGLLVLRWSWLRWLHLPAAVWGALIELTGWGCPLTPLEKWLWEAGGRPAYEGGFIAHYIVPVLYPPGLTRGMQVGLAVVVVTVNVLIYRQVLSRRGRR